ncbi:MAG: phytoene desaturase family protein [Ktedonobacterales bacterium]
MAETRECDVIVIGAGLGGLLSAVQFLRRGQRVVVVERLAHPGGRFTAKTFRGAQVSTGAVHMIPFGTNGELAGMLRALAIPHRIHDSEVFASFHVRGRQVVCRSRVHLLGVLGVRPFAELESAGAPTFLGRLTPQRRTLSFKRWAERRGITPQRTPELYAFFERTAHFALSVDLADVSFAEVAAVTRNMFRYGVPGIVDGGCAALTGELERRVLEAGGELRLQHDVLAIEHDGARVVGVRTRDKQSGAETRLVAPLVISNIGPEMTARLTGETDDAQRAPVAPFTEAGDGERPRGRREASGLKVHLLSDVSVIPHRGIMYCLDTERIAGVVQPSNSDPRLAPPGKHLLITHQLMRSDDVNAEREAARQDLRRLFGDDFGTKITILTMSQYRGEWPVNRMAQGNDVSPLTRLAGLYLVGDAVKPSGYLMVEGVAQSVNTLLDVLDTPVFGGVGRAAHTTPAKPSRARAVQWLLHPPAPHPGS